MPEATARADASQEMPLPVPPRGRVTTGDRALDVALGEGLPFGVLILLEGDEGAGAVELAFTTLLAAPRDGRRAVFATALRAPRRVEAELATLMGDAAPALVDVRELRPRHVAADAAAILHGLGRGDVVVLESVAAIARAAPEDGPVSILQPLADEAHEKGVVVLALHARGTVPPRDEAAVAEVADGILHFTWTADGPTRSRRLAVRKLRGLAPALDGEQSPVYEVALRRGQGFAASRVRQLV
ncbi:MAG TPA: hypothetical protein VI997_05965 [Candidatus Thermoplasmatota archaeon]|nr:hypothetical protein [Candidatus Thermoplasmatota archaeon]